MRKTIFANINYLLIIYCLRQTIFGRNVIDFWSTLSHYHYRSIAESGIIKSEMIHFRMDWFREITYSWSAATFFNYVFCCCYNRCCVSWSPRTQVRCKSGQLAIVHSLHSTPETRFSEILDLMNKLQLPFSYFTLYPDMILVNRLKLANKRGLTTMFTKSSLGCMYLQLRTAYSTHLQNRIEWVQYHAYS